MIGKVMYTQRGTLPSATSAKEFVATVIIIIIIRSIILSLGRVETLVTGDSGESTRAYCVRPSVCPNYQNHCL